MVHADDLYDLGLERCLGLDRSLYQQQRAVRRRTHRGGQAVRQDRRFGAGAGGSAVTFPFGEFGHGDHQHQGCGGGHLRPEEGYLLLLGQAFSFLLYQPSNRLVDDPDQLRLHHHLLVLLRRLPRPLRAGDPAFGAVGGDVHPERGADPVHLRDHSSVLRQLPCHRTVVRKAVRQKLVPPLLLQLPDLRRDQRHPRGEGLLPRGCGKSTLCHPQPAGGGCHP